MIQLVPPPVPEHVPAGGALTLAVPDDTSARMDSDEPADDSVLVPSSPAATHDVTGLAVGHPTWTWIGPGSSVLITCLNTSVSKDVSNTQDHCTGRRSTCWRLASQVMTKSADVSHVRTAGLDSEPVAMDVEEQDGFSGTDVSPPPQLSVDTAATAEGLICTKKRRLELTVSTWQTVQAASNQRMFLYSRQQLGTALWRTRTGNMITQR